ncbi:MAG: hypothetical protein GVY33_12480 [Alphaproteobacteria bacterium]|jgi:hypothetical protein|nr:hypothetical protein [Alphaproteobacteria bacterium]
MRAFKCARCGLAVYFENTHCGGCGALLGFLPDALEMLAFAPAPPGEPWAAVGRERLARPCANRDAAGCNWMTAAADGPLCAGCVYNRTIPDLTVPSNPSRWQRLERAKRMLLYGLFRLGFRPPSRADAPGWGLAFDFVAATPGAPAVTGHAAGVVTIDVAEADDVVRTSVREQMAELYRTLLGHFRHESGHFFWERLVRDGGRLDAFRARFGDERADYRAALDRHYAAGPPADWNRTHISAYAAAHPWEDWAECWAHYLHIVDSLETARAFGLAVAPTAPVLAAGTAPPLADPYRAPSARALVDAWLPLVVAVNSLNRSMGLGDLYPFVLTTPVVDKLEFIHRAVADTRSA